MSIFARSAAASFAAALAVIGTVSVAQSPEQAPEQPAADAAPYTAYVQNCGMCHLAGGMGTNMLAVRYGQERALLDARTDLPAAYIELIVRNGLNSMPPITRADVTEEELTQITAYLTRNNTSAAGGSR